MAEAESKPNPMFIDVDNGSDQYPITIIVEQMSTATDVIHAIIVNDQTDDTVKSEPACETERPTSPLHNTNNSTPYTEIQTRRIRCKECSKYTAENEEKMLRHVRKVHRGENPFQCYMCDYSTYNKSLFEEHVRIHQGIKPFKCSHCPYRSASKKNTKKHELIHRPDNPHKCKECAFIGRHLKSLQCHMNLEHSGTKLTDGEAIRELCTFCNRKFEDYKSHINNRRKCTDCHMLFCSQNLLRKHMLSEHNDKHNKYAKVDFECVICNWSSNIKPKILLHLIHHPNQPVDESVIDVHILKECGIVGQGWGADRG